MKHGPFRRRRLRPLEAIRAVIEGGSPRLEHLAELLVVGIAEGAAGAGGTGRVRLELEYPCANDVFEKS